MLYLRKLQPEFFTVDTYLTWSGDAEPNRLAFDREDSDRQPALGHDNSFTELATDDEHEGPP